MRLISAMTDALNHYRRKCAAALIRIIPHPVRGTARNGWDTVVRTVQIYGEIDGEQRSASFAYYVLFSLFPLFALLLTVGSNFLNPQEIIGTIEGFLPIDAPQQKWIWDAVHHLETARGGVGTISVIVLLWSSLRFFQALVRGVNRAWHTIEIPWWQMPLKNLLMVGIISSALLAGLLAPALLQGVRNVLLAAESFIPMHFPQFNLHLFSSLLDLGRYAIGGFNITDTHNYGTLTVEGVIQKSSNVGALKIAQKMSPHEMWDTFTALGYGQKPQIQFRGAVTGRVRPWKTWRPVEQATMSYGYGLSASLFQMAHSYTAFAHDGRIIPLTMLKSTEPAVGVKVFSPENAQAVRRMLQMAAAPGGTGQLAQTVGYSVGGKSGTAHKQVGKGYASDKYRAWFTGMAPIDTPRIIVAVMIDEPSNGQYFGGVVAAPVFSEVVQQTLRLMNVQPDVTVKPQIVANPVEESL